MPDTASGVCMWGGRGGGVDHLMKLTYRPAVGWPGHLEDNGE